MKKQICVFDSQKNTVLWGIGQGCVAFIVCSIWYSVSMGILFAALFGVAGVLKVRVKRPVSGFLINAIWGIVCIFLSCCLPTVMVSSANYLDIGLYRVVMNFLCAAVVYGLFLAITGSIKSAVVTASTLLMILSTANGFLFQFRGNLLKPMDLLFVKTAMNVAGQYVFEVREGMAYSWILWLWSLFCLRVLPRDDRLIPKRWLRALAAAATVICTAVCCYGCRNIKMNTWSNEGATRNGYLLNFAVGFRDWFIAEPEGYSEEALAELEKTYAEGYEPQAREDLPNVIVIMNESFADFDILGNDLRTNQPVTPFVDSLTENTVRGYALTSIFGGTTANAEFEFLTGLSMANMPEGSCPYQQYINQETYSITHLMKELGYDTFATHPYFSSGWNRTNVYPHLGFERMTFDTDYPYQDLIREFVSDREMYRYVLDALEDGEEAPLFLFGITMQNHGDYIYEGPNYEQTIFLEDYAMDHPMAEQYLTLLHESDKAVETFLTELERWPEDTIVLFFGDHFPQVEGDFFLEVHGGPFEDLSEKQLQYTIPFFIWANYDIPEKTIECTSLNYLGRYLLEAAGIPLPPYYRFLKDLETVIPAVNANGYYSLSQGTYLPLDQAEGEEERWLDRYEILQYNGIFDRNNQSALFFGDIS